MDRQNAVSGPVPGNALPEDLREEALKKLERFFSGMDLPWSENKGRQYMEYMEGILEWNEKVNLTTITDPEEFLEKHYLDSLTTADFEEVREADRIIDVGTGGGFPGIPLAIAFPEKEFVLVDSLKKRLTIIDNLCKKLDIRNVRTAHGRAEDLARRPELREKFDLCVSRAVANMSTLAEYCLPFVAVGGTFIAYKGPGCREELEEASMAVEELGGEIYGVYYTELEDFDSNHVLVFTGKIRSTPKRYPRKAGTPSKQPL